MLNFFFSCQIEHTFLFSVQNLSTLFTQYPAALLVIQNSIVLFLKRNVTPPKLLLMSFFLHRLLGYRHQHISPECSNQAQLLCKRKTKQKTPHLHKTHLMHQQERRRSNVRDSKEFLDFRAKPGVSSTQEVMQYLPLSLDLLSE